MNITGLVNRIRTEFLDDNAGSETGQFWKTPNIISALSLAERELCRRLYLLHDSTTTAICQIPIIAGTSSYTIDSRILRIERLKYPGVTIPLTRVTTDWLDRNNPEWESRTGLPSFYVLDTDSLTITFDSKPLVAGTVNMTVKRLPLLPLLDREMSDFPELQQLDDELIHGALKYLYMKADAETFDTDMVKRWEDQFETDIAKIVQNRAAFNPQITICRPERF